MTIIIKHKTYSCIVPLLIIVISTYFIQDLSGQKLNTFKGIGLEIGGGHNQLYYEETVPTGPSNSIVLTRTINRLSIFILPTARISYNKGLTKRLELYSFVGLNQTGGRNSLRPSRIIDTNLDNTPMFSERIIFSNIESGFMVGYTLEKWKMYIGSKVSYLIRAKNKLYREGAPVIEGRPNPNGHFTTDVPEQSLYDWGLDAGLRVSYPLGSRFELNAEAWFGISDYGRDFDLGGPVSAEIFIRQNHYRLLLGYRF